MDNPRYIQHVVPHSWTVGHNYLAKVGIKVRIYTLRNSIWCPLGLRTNNADIGIALQKF